MVIILLSAAIAEVHRTGLLIETEMPEWALPSPPIKLLVTYDDACDYSANFPPIGSQGAQGSCTAWAVGYYHKTYQEWLEHGWDVSLTSHQFSPAFIYNQINGGGDYGSYMSDAFKVLCDMGCATQEDMPYTQYNYTNFPDESDYLNGANYRCEQYYYMYLRNTLTDLKNLLLNGQVAVLGIEVYPNFDYIHNYNYTYCLSEVYGSSRGGHAVTFCGFDDARATADGTGAFKLANSWSTGWGDSGYFWMSYEAVMSYTISHGWAYYATDKIDYSPTLLTTFHVTHNDRYAVEYRFGIGSHGSPLWAKSFFNWYIPAQTTVSYPSSNIVLDLTDGAGYLTYTDSNDMFMRGQDTNTGNGYSGTITYFFMEDLSQPASGISPDPPVAILDNGAYAYADLILSDAPKVVHVPGDYATIQAAINASIDGDTVLVADGTYTGAGNKDLDYGGRAIVVKSENGADNCIIDCEDDGRGFYFHSGEDSNSVLEGFKIINGSYIGSGGGGIDCNSSSPSINYCTISGNYTSNDGGGIRCYNNSNPTIQNCTITGNTAHVKGGGIHCSGSSPMIIECFISDNIAEIDPGGGIACHNYSSPIIEKCNIIGNIAEIDFGGGIYIGGTSNPSINHSTISENSTASDGGGIYIESCHSTIENCTISGNSATINGGGILCKDIDNNFIVVNSILEGNIGYGGIYFDGQGSSDASITYSDFYNNQGGDFTGDVPAGLGTLTTTNANGDSCDVYYNIFEDPLFVDAGNGDYHLQSTTGSYHAGQWLADPVHSPCIDAGHPDSSCANEPEPNGELVNMGAYGNTEEASLSYTPLLSEHVFAAGWHLMSIPLLTEYSLIDSLFGDNISGTYFVFDYAPNNGYFLIDSVEHGKGYWLALEDTSTVDIEGDAEGDSTVVDLCQGWNLVGAAQNSDYPRDSLNFTDGDLYLTFSQAVDSAWIAASFYRFDNETGSYALEDTLEDWGGYWMNALEDYLQMITYPLSGGDDGFVVMKDKFKEIREDHDFNDWSVTIALRQGGISSDIAGFGVNEDATDGYDPWFDFPLPPTPPSGSYVRAVFEHPEWSAPVGNMFCTDIRSLPANESRYLWTFRVEASDTGLITVSFKGISEHLPAGYTAIASHGDKSTDLLKRRSITFNYTSPYEVTVTITGINIAGEGVDGLFGMPAEYSVAGIYPNPFNPVTTIRIGLPKASALEVYAYNILGRRVWRLADGWYQPGWHNIAFDASHLSSGIYFIKVEAPGELNEIRKVVLIR